MMTAHDDEGQVRKVSGARYWTHPEKVCDILESIGIEDEDILAAALLHDTVEDTAVDKLNLEETFGQRVADLVSELTNTPGLEGLSKEDYINKKLVNLSEEALTVKIADMIANSIDRPRSQQLERMKRNVDYLIEHRHISNRFHDQLIRMFRDV
jgi:(p)ppGpp synthase/HD superfamily hydrolase